MLEGSIFAAEDVAPAAGCFLSTELLAWLFRLD